MWKQGTIHIIFSFQVKKNLDSSVPHSIVNKHLSQTRPLTVIPLGSDNFLLPELPHLAAPRILPIYIEPKLPADCCSVTKLLHIHCQTHLVDLHHQREVFHCIVTGSVWGRSQLGKICLPDMIRKMTKYLVILFPLSVQ